jgi:hypothetical protein
MKFAPKQPRAKTHHSFARTQMNGAMENLKKVHPSASGMGYRNKASPRSRVGYS